MQWFLNGYRLGLCAIGLILLLSACGNENTASNAATAHADEIVNYRPSSSTPQDVGDRLVGRVRPVHDLLPERLLFRRQHADSA